MLELRWRLLKARTTQRGWAHTLRTLKLRVHMLKHSTPRKLINLLLVKAQKWLRRDHVVGMPYRYNIDPLNVCNLRCPLCPTGLGTLQRDRGKMAFEDYTKIIDQISPYAYFLDLYNWGEPFLHPHIFDMIRYASERNIFVRLSSNMNRFDAPMAAETVASGLDAVIVSVDGATQATYEKYRKRGQLSKVVRNVELLVEAKRKAKSPLPYIIMRMLVNRYNEHEIAETRQMATDLGADIFTIGTLFVDTRDRAQAEEWLPLNSELSYYGEATDKLENVWHCSELWEAMTINWDGGLSPCCWIQDAENDFDNATSRSLEEIWNGPALVSSRRVFAFGGAKPGPQKTICSVCKGHPEYLNY